MMGFVGTWAGHNLISSLGLLNAGIAAIVFQVRLSSTLLPSLLGSSSLMVAVCRLHGL